MSTSLRDQLLKVGLINQKQANDAERLQQHRERQRDRGPAPQRRPPRASEPQSSVRAQATIARPASDRLMADRLQAERKKAERKARLAELKQLIEQNRLTASGEGEAYHFIDSGKIKRVTVDTATRAKIASGAAVIVRLDGHYDLLPAELAQRMRERDERLMIVKPPVAEPAAGDAAYDAFPVPDDLIW